MNKVNDFFRNYKKRHIHDVLDGALPDAPMETTSKSQALARRQSGRRYSPRCARHSSMRSNSHMFLCLLSGLFCCLLDGIQTLVRLVVELLEVGSMSRHFLATQGLVLNEKEDCPTPRLRSRNSTTLEWARHNRPVGRHGGRYSLTLVALVLSLRHTERSMSRHRKQRAEFVSDFNTAMLNRQLVFEEEFKE